MNTLKFKDHSPLRKDLPLIVERKILGLKGKSAY